MELTESQRFPRAVLGLAKRDLTVVDKTDDFYFLSEVGKDITRDIHFQGGGIFKLLDSFKDIYRIVKKDVPDSDVSSIYYQRFMTYFDTTAPEEYCIGLDVVEHKLSNQGSLLSRESLVALLAIDTFNAFPFWLREEIKAHSQSES